MAWSWLRQAAITETCGMASETVAVQAKGAEQIGSRALATQQLGRGNKDQQPRRRVVPGVELCPASPL
ncbi:hypothetical protein SLITK23_36970 [Streptomyces lividans]|nr:hypothetical protein SLITK23_36970 [Streptomyces lividans]